MTTTSLSQILVFPMGSIAVEVITASVTSTGGMVNGGMVSFTIDGLTFNAPVQNGQATAIAVLPLPLAAMPQSISLLFAPANSDFAGNTAAVSVLLSILDAQDFSFVMFNSDGDQTVSTLINGVPIGLVYNAQGQFIGVTFGMLPSLP